MNPRSTSLTSKRLGTFSPGLLKMLHFLIHSKQTQFEELSKHIPHVTFKVFN
jgi:hypothetical protein